VTLTTGASGETNPAAGLSTYRRCAIFIAAVVVMVALALLA
jgi:hypothetical protein